MSDTSYPADARPGPSILVTGAAGNLGREVVDRLQTRGAHVRRLVRRAVDPRPGLGSVVGDITDPAVIRAALVGVDAIFLIWPRLDAAPAHTLAEELLAAAPRVVYLSSTAIDDHNPAQSDPIVQVHADMEALLQNAGLRPVILRSDTLASNVRGWATQLRAGDVVTGPDMPRTAVVDERDVADAATTVLLTPHTQLDHGPHLLTGPELLNRADQVAQLGSALGRDLSFQAVAAELARARMLADGRPTALVDALISASLHRPESTLVTNHVEHLIGRPSGTFTQWAADHTAEFQ